MRVQQLVEAMAAIAPLELAESWDNVGLLTGDPSASLDSVLLCIDYTPAVAAEARQLKAQAVVTYHPPLFKPIKSLRAGEAVFDAIRDGIALYSPHTALDVANGGTNDLLADTLQCVERKPIRLIATASRHCKLVTFVPADSLEKVSEALFAAGAGKIGDYSSCSFRSDGTGTFFGEEGSHPAVGQPGRLERAPEVRIETLLPIDTVEPVIAALKKAHPYETPAFDLLTLTANPTGMGQGRVGKLAEPTAVSTLLSRIKTELGLSQLLVAGAIDRTISTVGVCAGSCGDLWRDARQQGAEFFLTGEMRHHDALAAVAAGMTVVCTLHSNSERASLTRLAQRLSAALPALKVQVSRTDRDPFSIR